MLTFPDFKEKQLVVIYGYDGYRVKAKNDNLLVLDKEENTVTQHTCYRIFSIWVLGNTTLTSGILEKSKKYGFSIYLLSRQFRPIGAWGASSEGNYLLRSRQYTFNSLTIAKHLIKNKLSNQKILLKTIRKKADSTKKAIQEISRCINKLDGTMSRDELMGLEGYAARIFFKEWFGKYDWNGRRPRVKHDPINVLLDMGYTYLFNFIESLLLLYGFDIYKGVYHQLFYQRKSLVCDLVEPFRCIIDHKINVAYGLKQISHSDFVKKHDQYQLTFSKSKPYTEFLFKAILEHRSEIFLYIQSYYRQFMKEASVDTFPIFTFNGKNK